MAKSPGWLMTKACAELHRLLTILPRHGANFDHNELPTDGLYVMFQKGETAHGTDRIVRVGTHRGDGQLGSRLHQHFHNPNKDRSIFRKHLGRAILTQAHDPFLEQWDWDLTTRRERERLGERLNEAKQCEVEAAVTTYLAVNFTFTVLVAETKSHRMQTEEAFLSTLASCDECHPSSGWLGLNHPNATIRSAGLWNIQGLKGQPLDVDKVFETIRPMIPRV